MKMSPATKMMVMGDRYKKAADNGRNESTNGGYNQDRNDSRSPRTSTAMGHTYDRTQDRARDNTQYGRERNASGSYGYDPDIDVNRRGQGGRRRNEEDDEWSGSGGRNKPQRMYAAGMAWAEPDEADDDEDEYDKHRRKKQHVKEVDEECAHKWVSNMKNADGTPSPHFKPEQAEALRKAHCPDCDKWEWFVATNMMYADYVETAKKFSANKDEFYAAMAKAFLMDEDAGPGKLAKYMEAIPKK